MPNRILRPGINDSDRIDALSCGAEIFYRRLMSVVDDFGRFEADIRKLRSQCWPKKFDGIKSVDLTKWLDECSTGDDPLILIYENKGKQYIEIQNFGQRLKEGQKSKFPDPFGLSGNFPEVPASRVRSPSPSPSKKTPPTPTRISDPVFTEVKAMLLSVGMIGADEDWERAEIAWWPAMGFESQLKLKDLLVLRVQNGEYDDPRYVPGLVKFFESKWKNPARPKSNGAGQTGDAAPPAQRGWTREEILKRG